MANVMVSSMLEFAECPEDVRKLVLEQIGDLKIRRIKKEEEFAEVGHESGPPGHRPTGFMIFTISGHRRA